MDSLGGNVVICPHCEYKLLFPPAEDTWDCSACGEIIRKLDAILRIKEWLSDNSENIPAIG